MSVGAIIQNEQAVAAAALAEETYRPRRGRRDDVRVLYPGPDSLMIRSARPGDTPHIFELLESFAARGLLLRRTLRQVREMIGDFIVAVERDGRVLGCGALRVYSDTLAEVAALAVDESRQGRGVGARIVGVLEAEAAALGVRRLFALTLQDGFFRRLGFRVADVRDFPEKIARDCTGCAHRSQCVEIAVVRELRFGGFAELATSVKPRSGARNPNRQPGSRQPGTRPRGVTNAPMPTMGGQRDG